MGLNASAAFSFLNLNNNPYSNQNNQNGTSGTSNQSSFPNDTAGTLGLNDATYNMPQGSIYDATGAVAYNYYNTSFSTSSAAETAGSIASAETAGSIASAETAGSIASSSGAVSSSGASVSSSGSVASSGGSSGGSSGSSSSSVA